MSAMFNVSKIVLMLYFCSLVALVSSACLKYGHACWGGHGKRSGIYSRVLPMPLDSIIMRKDYTEFSQSPQFRLSERLGSILENENEKLRDFMKENDIYLNPNSIRVDITSADIEDKSPFFVKLPSPFIYRMRNLLTKNYNEEKKKLKKKDNVVSNEVKNNRS